MNAKHDDSANIMRRGGVTDMKSRMIAIMSIVLMIGFSFMLSCVSEKGHSAPELRETPLTTESSDEVKGTLFRNGNYVYIHNEFIVRNNGTTVYDRATGLLWEQSGSEEAIPHSDATIYCDQLPLANKAWRLPTVEELLSLMEPPESSGDVYFDPAFNSRQSWVWSADMRQVHGEELPGSAWMVDFSRSVVGAAGSVGWGLVVLPFHVRCVCSEP